MSAIRRTSGVGAVSEGLTWQPYEVEALRGGSRAARGLCSVTRCKEEPVGTLARVRVTGVVVHRALCAEHAARRHLLTPAEIRRVA